MCLNDLLDDGEPQTGAFLVPAPGDIGLVKTVPDLGDAVPGDTDAAVLVVST